MIVIRVVVQVQPEKRQDFLAFMSTSIPLSRSFIGCAKFDLYQDIHLEHSFMLYEEWQSLKDFDAYRQSDHFKESGTVLFPLMNGQPDTAYFEAKPLE